MQTLHLKRAICLKGEVLIFSATLLRSELPVCKGWLGISRCEFCWLCSPGGHHRRQENKPERDLRTLPDKSGGKAVCGTLRESPDKSFVLSWIPQLNYSYTAIIFYLLFDSKWNVGVKAVLWSLEMLAAGSGNRVNKTTCFALAENAYKPYFDYKWQLLLLYHINSGTFSQTMALQWQPITELWFIVFITFANAQT